MVKKRKRLEDERTPADAEFDALLFRLTVHPQQPELVDHETFATYIREASDTHLFRSMARHFLALKRDRREAVVRLVMAERWKQRGFPGSPRGPKMAQNLTTRPED